MSSINVIAGFFLGVVSAYFLVNGFRTGVMKCFVSLALQGEARRNSNPAWFWTWAGFNVFMVVGAILLVAKPVALALFPCKFGLC